VDDWIVVKNEDITWDKPASDTRARDEEWPGKIVKPVPIIGFRVRL
jgi:hypothetical protein